jgi:hypothetical protein
MRTPTPQGSHNVVFLSLDLLPPCLLTVLFLVPLRGTSRRRTALRHTAGLQITPLQGSVEGWDEEETGVLLLVVVELWWWCGSGGVTGVVGG